MSTSRHVIHVTFDFSLLMHQPYSHDCFNTIKLSKHSFEINVWYFTRIMCYFKTFDRGSNIANNILLFHWQYMLYLTSLIDLFVSAVFLFFFHTFHKRIFSTYVQWTQLLYPMFQLGRNHKSDFDHYLSRTRASFAIPSKVTFAVTACEAVKHY